MARSPLLEASFLIPTVRDAQLSDGTPHDAESWEWLDDRLYDAFGGRTIGPGLYSGFYRDPDTQQRVADESRKFTVAISEDGLNLLRATLRNACIQFQQKMIYLSVGGLVEFVEADDNATA